MAVTIYGIKSCDTVRKARTLLDQLGVDYRFHDFRTDGLDPQRLDAWIGTLGWDKLLNKSSTSFRALSPAKKTVADAATAAALMLAEPTLIKRPVLDVDGDLAVGFQPETYRRMLQAA